MSTKLLIHGIALRTGFMTPTFSILSISCLKASLRCIGTDLQGVCLGGTFGSIWISNGLPGNFPIPSNTSGNLTSICSFLEINQLSSGIRLVCDCVDLAFMFSGKVVMIGFSFMWCMLGFCGLVLLG